MSKNTNIERGRAPKKNPIFCSKRLFWTFFKNFFFKSRENSENQFGRPKKKKKVDKIFKNPKVLILGLTYKNGRLKKLLSPSNNSTRATAGHA